jgi:hypothetical protein
MHREEVGSKTVILRGTHRWPHGVALAHGVVVRAARRLSVGGTVVECMAVKARTQERLQVERVCGSATLCMDFIYSAEPILLLRLLLNR